MVAFLAQQLVAWGHDVILLASKKSQTPARLISIAPAPLRRFGYGRDRIMLEGAKARAVHAAIKALEHERVDVVHNHVWRMCEPGASLRPPVVTTIHHPLDSWTERARYRACPSSSLVVVSRSQQRSAQGLPVHHVIHNGVPVETYPYSAEKGKYLAFLGRAAPEKGLETAIEVARRTGIPLRIGAKVERNDKYFLERIVPSLRSPLIMFLGEINQDEKRLLLRDALALLHPSQYSDPCPLAAIEAMACGTPVIAFANGALPEIVEDGTTGFVVATLEEMVSAVARTEGLSRSACRKRAGQHFSSRLMAQRYVDVYAHAVALRT
jgi:glycosyltransferase involved in cell wall biosynthesis